MGFPAARISDMHTCPMSDGPKPHVGGPISGPGHPQTLIGKEPAARVSDMATCVGPPDVIIAGAATVLINFLPAARQLDNTAHGGAITMGESSVLIGGPQFLCPFAITYSAGQAQFGTAITIIGSGDFQSKAIAAYVKLSTTPSGQKMINGIQNSGKNVTVLDGRDPNVTQNQSINSCRGANGTNSTICWDPSKHNLHGFTTPSGQPLPTGSDIILGHETVHAYHNSTGTNANGPRDSYGRQKGASSRGEERATVGAGGTSIVDPAGNTASVPDHSGDSPTENSLRRELGLPERETYYPTNWPGGPPW